MMQTLTNNGVPPTDIAQLSGHKKLQSVTNYSTVSQPQQMKMSQALANLATGNVNESPKSSSTSNATTSRKHKPNREVEQNQQQQQAMAFFSCAVIEGGSITISMNTLNQSPVAVTENVSPKMFKRIRVIDSDSG